jgi:hypothetical protein
MIDEQGAISGFSLSRVFVSGPLAENPVIPREVVVDAFQKGDALLVDFPELEAMFSGSSPDEEEPVIQEPAADGENTAETPEEEE